MEGFEDFDVGNQDLVAACIQELSSEGYDCASVELLMKMARDGELADVADVLGSLAVENPAWSGEILRMVMWSAGQEGASRGPDYATAAAILTYLVDQTDCAHTICPHLLVYKEQGPDCYDVAFTIGHMVKSRKTKQAAKLLKTMYADDTPQGQSFQSLVPCMLGTMVDFQHVDWASELVKQMCQPAQDGGQADYSIAGWCVAQLVHFRRPDWAASICNALQQQQLPWYTHDSLLKSVGSWSGDHYVKEIVNAMPAAQAPAGSQQQ